MTSTGLSRDAPVLVTGGTGFVGSQFGTSSSTRRQPVGYHAGMKSVLAHLLPNFPD